MRPIFTIHAGEYLAGAYIEKEFPHCRVWVPSKDTGIDLLITNQSCLKVVRLQVKFSKDFIPTHASDFYKNKIIVGTWFQFKKDAIVKSDADYWVLVMQAHSISRPQFLVIPPKELLKRIKQYHGDKNKYDLYFWVTNQNSCWETRSLNREDQKKTVDDTLKESERNFSKFLDAWEPLKNLR